MRVLVGTGNPAKFDRYAAMLRGLPGVEVVAPPVVPGALAVVVVEDGATAGENARKKARAYAGATGLPALSVDEALFIPALPAGEQPGTRVRRYLGREASDEELLRAFLDTIRTFPPDERDAVWHCAICLALPDGRDFGAEATVATRFTDRPALPSLPGYPLRSLQVDVASGKSLRALTPEEEARRLSPVYERVRGVVQAALDARQSGEDR